MTFKYYMERITTGYVHEGKIIAYDSLHNWFKGIFGKLSTAQKGALKKLYPFIPGNKFNSIIELRKPLVKQDDSVSCGVFALYYMKLIIGGHLPDQKIDLKVRTCRNSRNIIIVLRRRLKVLVKKYANSLGSA